MAKMTPQDAVKAHEDKRHKGEPKTFKKGGPTTDDRMRLGKNMSRAMNQKTG